MQYLKLFVDAETNPEVSKILYTQGVEGYGRYCLFMQLMADKCTQISYTCTLHSKYIKSKLRIYHTRSMVNFLQSLVNASLISFEIKDDLYTITFPKLSILITSSQKKTLEKITKKSQKKPLEEEIDLELKVKVKSDSEVDIDIDKKINTNSSGENKTSNTKKGKEELKNASHSSEESSRPRLYERNLNENQKSFIFNFQDQAWVLQDPYSLEKVLSDLKEHFPNRSSEEIQDLIESLGKSLRRKDVDSVNQEYGFMYVYNTLKKEEKNNS